MSGDHNQNQTDSGWRKRQLALDKKAENARELGLDYEPDKTVVDMAREAGFWQGQTNTWMCSSEAIEAFEALVRAHERELCAKVCDYMASRCNDIRAAALESASENIRARGQA